MRQLKSHLMISVISIVLVIANIALPTATACSRVVYRGLENTVITARSMDWTYDPNTNLWVLPRGVIRDGASGTNAIRWTSKYGSVVATTFDAATVEGMNEKGLVATLLNFSETVYPFIVAGDTRLALSVSAWAQFMLDNYATASEAVSALRQEPFYVTLDPFPDKAAGKVHLAITDATGDSAIFEYVSGKLTIYHGQQYQVVTNSPSYDQQLAINAYWQQLGGDALLPGTSRPSDRFVRASFYINAVPKTADSGEALAETFSVIRQVSTPLGFSTEKQPNASSTYWRTAVDHKNKRYYFESVRSPNIIWVALADLDFNKSSPAKKLTLTGNRILAGDATAQFEPAPLFHFVKAP